MRADVDCQGTALDEALIANVLPGAFVRPLVGVNSEMALQIRFPIEALQASVLARFVTDSVSKFRPWCRRVKGRWSASKIFSGRTTYLFTLRSSTTVVPVARERSWRL